MQTPIFPGRFQPFHNGHLMVIQGMMKVFESAVIVICESAEKNTKAEPFSVDERREMISAALLSADIMDATIVSVKDSESHENWATHIIDAAGNPAEPVVWSGDESIRAIFEKKGVTTKKIVPVPGIVGADIRAMMERGDRTWRSKVPAGAMDVIEGILEKKR